jgi:predicted CoA-binding protein
MITLVLGASPNPDRYSYAAVESLRANGHEVIAVGSRTGSVADVDILTEWPKEIPELDTITLYLGPDRQREHYARIIGYRPRRIIFNPGTENAELVRLARQAGIEAEMACTLVLLSLQAY